VTLPFPLPSFECESSRQHEIRESGTFAANFLYSIPPKVMGCCQAEIRVFLSWPQPPHEQVSRIVSSRFRGAAATAPHLEGNPDWPTDSVRVVMSPRRQWVDRVSW